MDIEKTLEFILEQQAQFITDLGQVNTVLLELANGQERTNAILETLAERHVELAQSHKDLADQHKATEQNLNLLISTVERHIAGHN